jgi:hypothetical protein
MATIPYTIVKTSNPLVWIVKWLTMVGSTDDVGAAFSVATVPGGGGSDRSVQFGPGTFGTSTMVFQGSNDGGTTWITLADPQGNALSKTANAIEAVLEYTAQVRPALTGSGNGTGLACWLVVKGSR